MHANIAKLITEVKEQIQFQDSERNDDRSQKYWNKQDPNLYKFLCENYEKIFLSWTHCDI
jgi:hypothetical protein